MPGQELLGWWWIREAFKFEDWDVAKRLVGAVEINLSRFGISVNGLLARERQQLFSSIYVPQATARHFRGRLSRFQPRGCSSGHCPDGARTLPEHTVCFSIVCNHASGVPLCHSRLPVSTRPVAEPPYEHVV